MERKGLAPGKQVAYFEYDFAVDGGAIGEIELRGNRIPAGAIITSGMIHIITAVTSVGAVEMTLGVEDLVDVMATTLKAAMTIGAILDVVPVGTAATAILTTTAGAGVTLDIAEAAATAGKFVVALEYL